MRNNEIFVKKTYTSSNFQVENPKFKLLKHEIFTPNSNILTFKTQFLKILKVFNSISIFKIENFLCSSKLEYESQNITS